MQALRVALFMLAAALTEAQAPLFGGQYTGDVRELTLQALLLNCAVYLTHLYGASRVHTMVTSQAQDTAVSNFQPHLDCRGSLGYTRVSLSTHHSMMALLHVACALPSRGQAQVSSTQQALCNQPHSGSPALSAFSLTQSHHWIAWFQKPL